MFQNQNSCFQKYIAAKPRYLRQTSGTHYFQTSFDVRRVISVATIYALRECDVAAMTMNEHILCCVVSKLAPYARTCRIYFTKTWIQLFGFFVIIGKVVAHAFFPDDDRGGSVHFDAEETWTVTATKGHCYFVVFFTIKCYSFK